MKLIEALSFVKQLRDYIEETGQGSGVGSWPPRAYLNECLRANRAKFPRDKGVVESFNRELTILVQRHWAEVGPCAKDCHGDHVKLTKNGLLGLELMKLQGCDDGEHVIQKAEVFRFPPANRRKEVA
jgi:hypothetical protein